ncbi:MAG TPA: transposase [Candidatus Acidoferrales bacterium]|nr:transposase [Candidatus Acidoferrales bacterium]
MAEDPYVYPGTTVLKNLAGLRDAEALRAFETDSVTRRVVELQIRPVEGHFDRVHLEKVHKYLFQDVFEWAGETRTVDIAKPGSAYFAFVAHINPGLDDLFRKLRNERALAGAATKDGTVTETITYRQEWSAYNAAQSNEKARVAELLRDLCSIIDNPVQQRGRPRLALADAIFCATMKVYSGMSARRATSDLREFAKRGLIDKAPHYNSVINALENPDLTPFLRRLIEESAAPLAAVETDFAADSSGFSTNIYARWFNAKYGREMTYNFWLKAHVMVGTRTNVITAVEVTDHRTNDSPMLPTLLQSSAKRFAMKRVSADKGYLADSNVQAIAAHGAEAFIAPKVSTVLNRPIDASRKKSETWDRMLHYYHYRKDDFLRHYHRRSNVETTFHMIKAKFGSRIRSKSATAMVNEVLCKVLCHNLCVLVQSIYELGIEATFWTAS